MKLTHNVAKLSVEEEKIPDQAIPSPNTFLQKELD
jgi:hypothetical protein